MMVAVLLTDPLRIVLPTRDGMECQTTLDVDGTKMSATVSSGLRILLLK
jgi:hypothetical protein